MPGVIMPKIDHLFLKYRRDELPNPFWTGPIENDLVDGRLGYPERSRDPCLRPASFLQLKTDLQAAFSLFL